MKSKKRVPDRRTDERALYKFPAKSDWKLRVLPSWYGFKGGQTVSFRNTRAHLNVSQAKK